MDLTAILFFTLAILLIVSASAVVMVPNPIYAALSLATTMVGLAFMYLHLNAFFIAGVQLIVYAGAVMVLFVMVLMLFDLGQEKEAFSGGTVGLILKLICGMVFTSGVALSVRESVFVFAEKAPPPPAELVNQGVKALAAQLFTKYLFAFEALGLLLLLIAVGVVAVARGKGGTHARS